jgi:NADPH:quinone reductase-like Zn-dependent oxidoreductase
MEAYFLVRHGEAKQAFERRPLHLSPLADDEVRVEVEAFGLNYADVMARHNMYREAPPIPSVLGYEVVGKVIAGGKNVPEDKMGKRVVAFTRFGGYATHVHTKSYAAIEIGDSPAGEALALATQYVTAYYMVNVVTNVLPGEHALVHSAAGGVGTALIQLLRLNGATVYAKSRSDKKKNYVLGQGADHFISYSQEDYAIQLKRLLGTNRLDISFNPVAGETFKKDMGLLGSGGRMILFGGAALSGTKWGIFSQLNFLRKMGLVIPVGLMMRSKNILGVNMLKLADNRPQVLSYCMTKVMELYQQGLLKPEVGATFAAHELANAHALLESGESMGKIVVKW